MSLYSIRKIDFFRPVWKEPMLTRKRR